MGEADAAVALSLPPLCLVVSLCSGDGGGGGWEGEEGREGGRDEMGRSRKIDTHVRFHLDVYTEREGGKENECVCVYVCVSVFDYLWG